MFLIVSLLLIYQAPVPARSCSPPPVPPRNREQCLCPPADGISYCAGSTLPAGMLQGLPPIIGSCSSSVSPLSPARGSAPPDFTLQPRGGPSFSS